MRIGNAIQPVVAKTIAPVVVPDPVVLPSAPVPPQPDALLAELSRLAYADLTTAEGWLRREGFSDIQRFDRRSTQAIGCVSNAVRYLAFRGTQETLDIFVDANLLLFGSPPQHLGFLLAWQAVRSDVLEWLQKGPPQPTLHLTGHSLGGALAVVAAYELQVQNYQVDRVVTFGCPRVGSAEFSRRYTDCGLRDRTTQYQHETDSVCLVPPPLVYVHATQLKPSCNPRGLASRPEVPKGTADILRDTNRLPPPTNPIGSINDVVWTVMQCVNPVFFALNHARKQNPEEPWLNAEKTSLGRSSEILAIAAFWFCMLAAVTIFTSVDQLALVVLRWIPLIVFQWLAALALQQVIYLVLWSVPVLPRLLLSVALAGAAAWMMSGIPVSVSVFSGLLIIIGVALLFLYRLLSGLPDHFMKYYLDWLGARDTRQLAEDLQKQLDARATHDTAKPTDELRK